MLPIRNIHKVIAFLLTALLSISVTHIGGEPHNIVSRLRRHVSLAAGHISLFHGSGRYNGILGGHVWPDCSVARVRLLNPPAGGALVRSGPQPCKCIVFARDVVSDVHDVSSAHAALWSAWLGRVPRVDRRVHLCRTAPIARVDVHLHRAADGGGSGARRLRAAVPHRDSITSTQQRADEAAREIRCAARVREVYAPRERRAGGGRAHEAVNRRRRHLGQALAHLLAHVARDGCRP